MNKETQIFARWIDPTIDDLKIVLDEANKQIDILSKEIEKLNNIINKFEKYLVDVKQFAYLDKLKALKEGK